MSTTVFEVADIFDIKGRAGLLLSGRLVQGEISAGDTLRDHSSGATVHVISMEFHGPGDGRFTIVVDRAAKTSVQPGSRLEAA
ncbi:MAG TPA: hypothetical protein VGM10_10365 [Actinocrinis sp.]|jgi:hypothetical protein